MLLSKLKSLKKFLEALGSRIGTCSVFCHSFPLSNNVYGQLLLRMTSLIYIPNGKSCNASDQIYDILMMEKWNPKWNLIWKALGQHITSFSWPFFICLQAQCSASKCKCALSYNIFDQMSSFRWAICSKNFQSFMLEKT